MIEIKNLVTQEPDDDGDIKVNLDVIYQNETEHDLGLLLTRLNIFNCDGLLVENSQDFHEVHLKKNDDWQDELRSGYFKASRLVDGNGILTLDIIPCRGFHQIIGETNLPFPTITGSGQSQIIHDGIEVIGYTVTSSKPDSDGDVAVEIRSSLRNLFDKYIPRAQIIGRILNASGIAIDELLNSGESIMPGEFKALSARGYINKKSLQGAYIEIDFKWFESIGLEMSKVSIK